MRRKKKPPDGRGQLWPLRTMALGGCLIGIDRVGNLVYFVDNIRTGNLEEIEENEVEKTETFPRINLYTRQKVFDILKSAKVRVRDGKFLRKIQLKAREDTCYGESSITQMNSLESQWISAVVSEGVVSEGILAGERMGQCSSVQSLHGLCPQNKQKRLHGLLFEMRKYAPDELKQQVSEFLGPEAAALRMTPTTTVDTLYDRLVLSKVKSSDPDKVVVDINNHVITETIFVDSFKPEGQMTPFALHAQCSIWNDCYCDRIYLKEESAMDLQQAGADQNLSCQLPENKMKHVKLIFVPVFCLGQCFLIVANFEKHSFDYLDSTDSTTGYQCAHEMTKNLKKYLKKCGINCDNWGFVTTPVKAHNNIYDSGYCLMLHMIHYGTEEVFRIDEEMISAYRKRFAVELFYHRTNKVCHTSSANKFDSGRTTSGTLSSAHPTSTNQTLLELQAVSENCGDEDQSKTSTAGDGDKSNTAARDDNQSNTAARDDNQSNTAARDADQEHRARRSALKTGYTTVAQYTKVPGSRSKELYDFIFSEGTELTDDRELATINGVSVTRDVVLKSFSVPVESCEVLHAFINCLKLNDRKNNRKERIFFLPLTSSIIENKEEAAKKIKEDMPKPFPKDYELIFFPILHEGKWVIFCVNNRHSRMEIMNINVSKNEAVQLRSSCLPVFLYGMKQVKTGNVKKPSFDN